MVGAGDEAGLAERQVEQVVPAERPERRPIVVVTFAALDNLAGRRGRGRRPLELGEGVEGEFPRLSDQGWFNKIGLTCNLQLTCKCVYSASQLPSDCFISEI